MMELATPPRLRRWIAPAAIGALALGDVWLTFIRPHDLPPSDFPAALMLPLVLAIVWRVLSQAPRRGSRQGVSRLTVLCSVALVGAVMVGRSWCPPVLTVGLFTLALCLAIVACPAGPRPPRRRVWWVPWAAVGLFVFAFALRHIGLETMPGGLWVDEAEHFANLFENPTGRAADPFDFTPHLHEGWSYISNLYLYTAAVQVHWHGLSVSGMKLGSTLPSALAPVAVFLLGVAVRRARLGLAAALLVATSPWHLIIGRWGTLHILCATLQIFALASVLRGLHREGDRRAWMVAGIILGLGFHAYLLAPFAVIIAVLPALAAMDLHPHRRARVTRGLPLLLLGMALAAGPLMMTLARDPEKIGGRTAEVSVMGLVEEEGPGVLLDNLRESLIMFLWRGDANPRHNVAPPCNGWWAPERAPAQLHPLWSVTLAIGVLMTLRHRRRLLPVVLLIWLGVGLLPSVLSHPSEVPHAYRAQLTIPAVALLAVWGLGTLTRRRLRVTAFAVPIIIAILGLSQFFGRHWWAPASVGAVWGGVETRLAETLRHWRTPEERAMTTVLLDRVFSTDPAEMLLHTAGYASVHAVDITDPAWPPIDSEQCLLAVSTAGRGLVSLMTSQEGTALENRFGVTESALFSVDPAIFDSDPLAEARGWRWRITQPGGAVIEVVDDHIPRELFLGSKRIEAEGLWWRHRTNSVRLNLNSNCRGEVRLTTITDRDTARWRWRLPSLHFLRSDPDAAVFPQPGLSRVYLRLDTALVEDPWIVWQWVNHWTGGPEPVFPHQMLHSPKRRNLWEHMWAQRRGAISHESESW